MVNVFVAITDRSWFNALSISQPDEVNFWQPSGSNAFRALIPGELLLFKLHAPDNYIVGGGVFSHASNLPLSIAWDAFGAKNGVVSLEEMRARIARYRRDPAILNARVDPTIGCRILTAPFFWPRELWLPMPEDFSLNIVRGKGYSTQTPAGLALWNAVTDRMSYEPGRVAERARYGPPRLIPARLGQGAFRLTVIDAYSRRCAISGEKTLPILDAAHVRAFGEGGDHEPCNGILLRTDIHRLFDLGYVTIAEDRRFEVSRRLREDFQNGRMYYDLHGKPVAEPRPGFPPMSAEALQWHREVRFLG